MNFKINQFLQFINFVSICDHGIIINYHFSYGIDHYGFLSMAGFLQHYFLIDLLTLGGVIVEKIAPTHFNYLLNCLYIFFDSRTGF